MNITLKPTDGGATPFVAEVESADWLHARLPLRIPIYVSDGAPAVYDLELCGFRLEAPAPEALLGPAAQLLDALTNVSRLPDYVFIARRSRGIYPVYTVGSEVLATTPGGPVFRHVELAKVREYLSDYLHLAGILGAPGRSEKLHVRGVDPETLALKRPIFYLKKRTPGEDAFWAPVFLSDDETRIWTYAANHLREVYVDDGKEVLLLREIVAQALITDGRLRHDHDLQADRLFPETWERLSRHLLRETADLDVDGRTLPLYRAAHLMLALEHRPDEERYSLYLGSDRRQLTERVRNNLARRAPADAAASL